MNCTACQREPSQQDHHDCERVNVSNCFFHMLNCIDIVKINQMCFEETKDDMINAINEQQCFLDLANLQSNEEWIQQTQKQLTSLLLSGIFYHLLHL